MITKQWEDLTLADDFMFGKIMTIPFICQGTLERILDVEIDHIEFPERQKSLDNDYTSKSIRMDVYVKDGKGTVYNIEMQTTNQDDLRKRSRYYQSSIDIDILDRGMDYSQLKKSFVIFICNFDLFGKGRHIYTFENICLEDTNLLLGDETTKIFLNTKGTLDDISKDLKAFLDYISTGIPSDDDFIQHIDHEVKSARVNTKWRREYMKYLLNLNQAKKEGMILAKILLVRNNYSNGYAPEVFAPLLDMDVVQVNKIINCITTHPDWSDEQIYQYLYVDSD